MIRISLNEDVRKDMVSNYSDSISTIQNALTTFFEQMQEIYTTHKYSPLKTTTEFLAEFWEEQVQSQVTREVEIWAESEASIENILKNMGAFGEDSNESQQAARDLQYDLLELTREVFNIDYTLKPISEAVSMERDLKQIFADFNDTANYFKQTVSGEADQLNGLVSNKSVDNKLYESFGYLTKIVFSALELQVDNINKQLDEAYNLIADIGSQTENIGRETAASLASESQNHAIETDFSDINHLFRY